jgi:hypothetical protein
MKKSSRKGLIAGLIGFVLFIITFLIAIFSVGELVWYIDFLCFLLVLGLSVGYGLMHCRKEVSLLKVVEGTKTGALYAGGICFFVALIVIFQILGTDLLPLWSSISFAIIAPLYSLLISAAARIAEIWLTPTDEN